MFHLLQKAASLAKLCGIHFKGGKAKQPLKKKTTKTTGSHHAYRNGGCMGQSALALALALTSMNLLEEMVKTISQFTDANSSKMCKSIKTKR